MGDTPFSVTFHNQHGEARGSRDGLPVLYSRKFVKSGDHHGIIINNNRTMLPNRVLVAAALCRRRVLDDGLPAFRHDRANSAKQKGIGRINLRNCLWIVATLSRRPTLHYSICLFRWTSEGRDRQPTNRE
jgi:hypothetical protein